MKATLCPICDTDHADREIYPSNFRLGDLTPEVFSARRLPDRLYYRMVRCGECGLLRSNPILPLEELARLYGSSQFTYGVEAVFARRTYSRYLSRAQRWMKSRAALLEIGCGSGFFLEEALQQGFQEVAGSSRAQTLRPMPPTPSDLGSVRGCTKPIPIPGIRSTSSAPSRSSTMFRTRPPYFERPTKICETRGWSCS